MVVKTQTFKLLMLKEENDIKHLKYNNVVVKRVMFKKHIITILLFRLSIL